MKYLHIPDLLFIILLIACILIEIVLISIIAIACMIWELKFPKTIWQDFHKEENTVICMEGSKEMEFKTESWADKNPWETFKRRWNWWNHVKNFNVFYDITT